MPDKPNKFFKINYRVEQTNLHTQEGVRELGRGRQKKVFLFLFHATKQIKQISRGFTLNPHFQLARKMSYCTRW